MPATVQANTQGKAQANPSESILTCDHLARLSAYIRSSAAFISPSLAKQRETFGEPWAQGFEQLLGSFIATDDTKMQQAVGGYVKFVLDGMRRQRIFTRTGQYPETTYAQAAEAVYLNDDYMSRCYLPGLMLSHYLWPHHYRQRLFFEKVFLSRFQASATQEFCDVGVGTGLYSRLLLSASARAKGWAFDISPSAFAYGSNHLAAYGVAERWATELRNIADNPPSRRWPFLICIELLEHLEDPPRFLNALHNMLTPDGCAFISAAVTAAEKDHIFLYRTSAEVQAQLEKAGFQVLDWQEDLAYEPVDHEPVPIVVAFMVTAAKTV